MATQEAEFFRKSNAEILSTQTQWGEHKDWRKVEVTSDPVSGNIVVTYIMPNGEPDVKHFTQQQFRDKASQIAFLIGAHVTP